MLWLLVVSCVKGEMRDVAMLDVLWMMGREEGFMALGRRELRRVLRRDMASFKQKDRSKEIKKAYREMCIL